MSSKKKPAYQKKCANIQQIIEQNPEMITPELLKDVHWLIEHGKEDALYNLYYTSGAQSLEIAIQEEGYRLYMQGQDTTLTLIPFALLFYVGIPEKDIERFPLEYPQSVDVIAKQKLLRKCLDLGVNASVFLDLTPYSPDNAIWYELRLVRGYLQSLFKYLKNQGPFIPLIDPHPDFFDFGEDITPETVHLVKQVLCGVVITSEEEMETIEEQLFGETGLGLAEEELRFRVLENVIQSELEQLGISVEVPVSLHPCPLDMWDIPLVSTAIDMNFYLAEHGIDPEDILEAKEQLEDAILELDGEKILTLVDQEGIQAFDLHDNGLIGYHPSHAIIFENRLMHAIASGGGVIIRQFLSLQTEQEIDGKKRWLPRKNIYSVGLGDGKWWPLSSEEVRKISCTDAITGKQLPPEVGVTYKTFPVSPLS